MTMGILAVDFCAARVLAYFLGQKPTTGYSVEIEDVDISDTGLVLRPVHLEPGQNCLGLLVRPAAAVEGQVAGAAGGQPLGHLQPQTPQPAADQVGAVGTRRQSRTLAEELREAAREDCADGPHVQRKSRKRTTARTDGVPDE